ncbi:MAG: CPBP family intramembrane metalloprotease [Zetaproteobacteria bacterium CG_4_9_14_3_um_filter_49_83]|nr:MAG: CPBP family intramembrane metalloprotease [Zetaproteobacteria bacterium CG17_big_fil_post_rev_8_21_14_2_50_50_13]PIV31370.1 MAG: CPBP family intramembrane metalloprotease [Zetaproteobacteria bacterium CG02_land_8_20_14_3_00_50_9]PIY56341.1 MAG: CPBP family intramembrane metalloprotease [Zetaproteobacteria bacterium CG_4_10_14_0_8_um_filter_49_80]PJA35766.1 MAG: CPBP family intramembrane metalloprotease [Zetaproteobacteria bacterium CG_4_9_14_3_um_filter_49_83]
MNLVLKRLIHDKELGAAILAAPVVWGSLILVGLPSSGNPYWPTEFPQRFLMLAFVYPILEEMVFRGLLQGWMHEQRWGARKYCGITSANFLTSALFAMLHLWSHAPIWALAVLVPSLVFGYFRDRDEGALRLPMLLHCYYNIGWLIVF